MTASVRAASGDPFSALGDPTRRSIVVLLQDGERSVQEIADELPISRPAVSRHLRLLKEAGIVAERAEGNRHLCSLSEEGLEGIVRDLEEMWGSAAARYVIAAENTSARGDG